MFNLIITVKSLSSTYPQWIAFIPFAATITVPFRPYSVRTPLSPQMPDWFSFSVGQHALAGIIATFFVISY